MSANLTLPTISGLAINQASWLAKRYIESGDWNQCRKEAMDENLMQIEKTASAERYLAYTIKLLKELTSDELSLLSDGNAETRRALMWLAFCRAYPLVGKFSDTVINQKFNQHDFTLSTGDWNEFLSRESHEHQEIEDIGKTSRAKAKSVLFGNLRSVGFLSSSNEIKDAMLSREMLTVIGSDVRYFPVFMER